MTEGYLPPIYKAMRIIVLLSSAALLLSACSGVKSEAKYPTGADRAATGGNNNIYNQPNSIFGEGGLKLFGNKDKDSKNAANTGIGVNALLWRASLDTINFMPITSADPFGGTIITDWYSAPSASEERFKVNIFILGRELRADNIKVTMFRQVRSGGSWHDADIADSAPRQLEDAVLTRARELRVAAQAEKEK